MSRHSLARLRPHVTMAVVAALALLCAACEVPPPAHSHSDTGTSRDGATPNAEPNPNPKPELKTDPKEEEKVLEEKDLRPALLRMVEANPKTWAPVNLSKQEINESPLLVHKEQEGRIELGNFRCDLKAKTFSYMAGGPGVSLRGRFVLNERSEWVAEVTTRAHATPARR